MSEDQAGQAPDANTTAPLIFALLLVDARGQLDDRDIEAMRRAGWSSGKIVAMLALVALNLLATYVKNAFAMPLDFRLSRCADLPGQVLA